VTSRDENHVERRSDIHDAAPGVHFTLEGFGPIIATAIHNGHDVRPSLLPNMSVSEAQRLRDEDPYTGRLTDVGDARLIVHTSRFEADMNRRREKAVYLAPDDAWGLDVWREPPDDVELEHSYALYDAFHEAMGEYFERLEQEHGAFVVLDLHSYNHMPDGPDGPPADPEKNPVVIVGTGNTDAERWRSLIDRFIADLRRFDTGGEPLDVRENVKFTGGDFTRWVHGCFPTSSCCLAVEFKKTFMDEWSGVLDEARLEVLRAALASAIPGVREELAARSGATPSGQGD